MIRGAIFDLDGTLLDSMGIWDTLGEEYLRSLGLEPKEEWKQAFQTFTLEQAARYCREHCGVALSVEEIVDGINHMAAEHYSKTIPLKPGAAEFLRKLKEHGVGMCVATVTDRPLAQAALERTGIRGYFSEIFTAASVGHGKDEPDIYRAALRHLGTGKAETVVFEDAFYALETAKADGFVTAAVFDAYEGNQAGLKAAADYYMESYSDWSGFWRRMSQ